MNDTITQVKTTDDSVILYLRDSSGEATEVSYQIGSNAMTDLSLTPLSSETVPIHTLIMWDNSLSIKTSNRDKVKQVLQDIIADRMDGEQFAIASVGDKLDIINDFTADYATLKATIDATEYVDKDAYIIDTVYEAVSYLNGIDDNSLKRIVLITDGMDNRPLGYTREELDASLKQHNIPIYVIGSLNANHADEMQQLYALARETNGDAVEISDEDSAQKILGMLSSDKSTQLVTVNIPEDMRDGSNNNSKLTYQSGGQEKTVETAVSLPFAKAEDNAVDVSEATVETTAAVSMPSDMNSVIKPNNMFLLIGGLFLALVVAIVVTMVAKKKKKKTTQNTPEQEAYINPDDYDKTVNIMSDDDDSEGTLMIDGAGDNHMLVLTDINQPAKTFRYPLNRPVIIGRKPGEAKIVIDYDRSVSSRHCEVYMQRDKCIIKDLQSSNGTQIDGQTIVGEQELKDGSVIKLGRVQLKVEIR